MNSDGMAASDASPPPASRAAWTASRLLALAAGAVILIWITKRTFGLALVPVLGVLVTTRVLSSYGKHLTTFTSWLTASTAAALSIAALLAFGVSKMPPGFLAKTMDSVTAIQQRTPPAKLPKVFERMQGGDSASRAAQESAQKMMRNPKFLGVSLAIGLVMFCSILGVILGTITWSAMLLLARGFMGAWPFRKEPEPATY